MNKKHFVQNLGIASFVFIFLVLLPNEIYANPLVEAAFSKNIEKVKHYISIGHNINERDNDGYTALIAASEVGDVDIVKWLISNKANIGLKNRYDATALHKALDAERPATKSLGNNHKSIALNLIEHGANVNAKGYNNTTALHIAAMRGDVSVVEALLKAGAHKNAKTKKGVTALRIATLLERKAIIKLLKE